MPLKIFSGKFLQDVNDEDSTEILFSSSPSENLDTRFCVLISTSSPLYLSRTHTQNSIFSIPPISDFLSFPFSLPSFAPSHFRFSPSYYHSHVLPLANSFLSLLLHHTHSLDVCLSIYLSLTLRNTHSLSLSLFFYSIIHSHSRRVYASHPHTTLFSFLSLSLPISIFLSFPLSIQPSFPHFPFSASCHLTPFLCSHSPLISFFSLLLHYTLSLSICQSLSLSHTQTHNFPFSFFRYFLTFSLSLHPFANSLFLPLSSSLSTHPSSSSSRFFSIPYCVCLPVSPSVCPSLSLSLIHTQYFPFSRYLYVFSHFLPFISPHLFVPSLFLPLSLSLIFYPLLHLFISFHSNLLHHPLTLTSSSLFTFVLPHSPYFPLLPTLSRSMHSFNPHLLAL
ncbi:unnamed protein product [Acanthosepion pharaonis]|uniref:Uncharacterized protein n=1 Tax=Acanthosepion pharaonis TaxID=158019 RepID=A0A812BS58_ACAPH|nr:unnamed protein product [Sepia pharaonis]